MPDFNTETAETVFRRTYSRTKPDGTQEEWPETVRRVVDGNLALVPERYIENGERQALIDLIGTFAMLPAGRHLKSSGVNPFALNNCWAAGWNAEDPGEHFTFTLLRLAEGGGVGANYSSHYFEDFPPLKIPVVVHIVCDPAHQDHDDLKAAGLLSPDYSYDWAGAYPVEDSREGWADAVGDLIRTAHNGDTRHVQRVFDVSRIRPKGAPLRSFGGTASGPAPFAEMLINIGKILADKVSLSSVLSPVSYVPGRLDGLDAMEMDHEIARCIVSGGVRRSARMSIMQWDDPLINEFIDVKRDGGHWTTNISVEVDDRFLQQLGKLDGSAWPALMRIATGMLRNGEPGLWNSALTAVGEVDGTYTTNPCGEATLTPWEPCNLGSINLGAFVSELGTVDRKGLHQAHRFMARYLIRATFAEVADEKSEVAIQRYRRVGVGHLGFADYLALQGILYSEAARTATVREDLAAMAEAVEKAAVQYSNELRIPTPVKTRVVAPTGTISKLAGASGEGIHAPFADYFIRRIRFSSLEPTEIEKIEEFKQAGYHVEPCAYAANTMVVSIPTKDPLVDRVQTPSVVQHAGMLTIEDMLSVQALYQEVWADQAVSYTVNVSPEAYEPLDLAEVLALWLPLLKGTTVFPEMSFVQPPYERIAREEYERLAGELGIETSDTSYDEACASGACPV
ncbi:ribonucleoside-triphosphate reductase, adenosylcobalamin-dependent [Streptomyces uncialis]|uniref:Adenosylcobalamin-dependent ribonucleoside-triphosphate reductase n=1 Tax=Streptomyces uncialis TaxID=1048205 RepID=A0A1Q4VCF0_9ACTN|nr:ribonucleoside-triphosphate reductase, adenosylcobalamin-dependent [Streptomyces uncialis]OKH95429.1 ribonucleoside-triphosphate reductase [Streptomyces uncialis]